MLHVFVILVKHGNVMPPISHFFVWWYVTIIKWLLF